MGVLKNYTWKEIENLPQPATEGELSILHWLVDNLEDEYEIYFQMNLNGDRPDILILRRNGGVVVIEVKDYDMELYDVVDDETWMVKTTGAREQCISSPLVQARKYKQHLINLHIPNMAEKLAYNKDIYAVIVPCLYFHNATIAQLDYIKNNPKISETYRDNIPLFCRENLDTFKTMLKQKRINGCSKYFADDFYYALKNWGLPTAYENDLKNPIKLTRLQEELGELRQDQKNTRIAGVAGSGKTTVLALKAFNSYMAAKREAEAKGYSKVKPILILTFNITLKNYIVDRLSMIFRIKKVKFDRSAFIVQHYHNFIRMYCNNNNIILPDGNDDEIDNFKLSNIDAAKEKYQTILIDEIQDFEDVWIENVQKVLTPGGKLYRFGDKIQNIYGRDDSKQNISKYRNMNETFRLDNAIVDLANYFSFNCITKDRMQTIGYREQDMFETQSTNISYCRVKTFRQAVDEMKKFFDKCGSVHPNDYCLMGSKIKTLRMMEVYLKDSKYWGDTFTTMFETEEAYNRLKQLYHDDKLEMELYNIRRSKKYNFWNNTGNMKICTIHSFKGWETVNGIVLLQDLKANEDALTYAELIYVALTRVRKNLLVMVGNGNDYSEKVKEWIDQYNRSLN